MLGNQYGIDMGNVLSKYYAIKNAQINNQLANERLNAFRQQQQFNQMKMDNYRKTLEATKRINYEMLKIAHPDWDEERLNQMADANTKDIAYAINMYWKADDRQRALIQQRFNNFANQMLEIMNMKDPQQREQAWQMLYAKTNPKDRERWGIPEHYNETWVRLNLGLLTVINPHTKGQLNQQYAIERMNVANQNAMQRLEKQNELYNQRLEKQNELYNQRLDKQYQYKEKLLQDRYSLMKDYANYKTGIKTFLKGFTPKDILTVVNLQSPDYQKIDRQIISVAKKYNIDPNLLRAMIYVESGFNPKARSDRGAIGIAQFMPGTAKRFGIDPTDPMQSIEGMAKYLVYLNRFFKGDWDKTIMAYNAGEGNISEGIIPDETKAYLPRVKSAYKSFVKIYKEREKKLNKRYKGMESKIKSAQRYYLKQDDDLWTPEFTNLVMDYAKQILMENPNLTDSQVINKAYNMAKMNMFNNTNAIFKVENGKLKRVK